jgi:hypothetical protein
MAVDGDSSTRTLSMVGLTTLVATDGDSLIKTLMVGSTLIITLLVGPSKPFFLLPIKV